MTFTSFTRNPASWRRRAALVRSTRAGVLSVEINAVAVRQGRSREYVIGRPRARGAGRRGRGAWGGRKTRAGWGRGGAGSTSSGGLGRGGHASVAVPLELFHGNAVETSPDEPVEVELRFLGQDVLEPRLRRRGGRPEEGADLRAFRDLVRADHLRAIDDLLLVEAEQRSQNRMARRRVDHPQVREGLARGLSAILSRGKDVGRLAVRERVRQADHEPLREYEVQSPVAQVCDLRERLADADDVQGRKAEEAAKGPRLRRRRGGRDRLAGG